MNFFQRETEVLWTESQIFPVLESLFLQKVLGGVGGGGGKNHLFLLIWKRDFWAKAVKRFVAWLCQHGLSKSQGMNQKLMEEVMG